MVTRLRRMALTDAALPAFGVLVSGLVLAAGVYGGWEAGLMVLALLWLTIMAAFDVKSREIPHAGLVLAPFLGASGYGVWRGDWALAGLALVVLAASERDRLPGAWRRVVVLVALAACAGLLWQMRPESLAGALAVLVFWVMFDLNWWAGMDALAAITLVVLWPDLAMVLAIGLAHLGLALVSRRPLTRPRPLRAEELLATGRPGFPALALSMGLYWILWLLK